MERKKLERAEIDALLEKLDGWAVKDIALKKRFTFEDFTGALRFVNMVGAIAESLDHHPDITFGWGYADVSTTTHDRGGITDFDLALVERIETVAGKHATA